jgi:hypothetical protein
MTCCKTDPKKGFSTTSLDRLWICLVIERRSNNTPHHDSGGTQISVFVRLGRNVLRHSLLVPSHGRNIDHLGKRLTSALTRKSLPSSPTSMNTSNSSMASTSSISPPSTRGVKRELNDDLSLRSAQPPARKRQAKATKKKQEAKQPVSSLFF